jgi:ABC-2 type transport system permease protein
VISALRYEWTRIRTIRSTWWLSVIALVVGVGISTLFAWAIHHDFSTNGVQDQEDLRGLGAAVVTQLGASGQIPSVVSFVLAMIGIFAWGHEYRHGMIRASLTALNSRTAFWLAKYLVVAVWVAVSTLVVMLLSGLVGVLFLNSFINVFEGLTWSIIGRQVIFAVLLAWLAMAFTSLTRSQAFALVTIFLWPLLIEHLILVFFLLVPSLRDNTDLLRFLPFDAGNKMLDVLSDPTSTFGDPLSPLGGGMVFGGLAVVMMVASYVSFERRDA